MGSFLTSLRGRLPRKKEYPLSSGSHSRLLGMRQLDALVEDRQDQMGRSCGHVASSTSRKIREGGLENRAHLLLVWKASLHPCMPDRSPLVPCVMAQAWYESLAVLCLDITGAASSCPSIAPYGTALSMLRLSLSC